MSKELTPSTLHTHRVKQLLARYQLKLHQMTSRLKTARQNYRSLKEQLQLLQDKVVLDRSTCEQTEQCSTPIRKKKIQIASRQELHCMNCQSISRENNEMKNELSFMHEHRDEVNDLMEIKEILNRELILLNDSQLQEKRDNARLHKKLEMVKQVKTEFEELILELLKQRMSRRVSEIALAAARISGIPQSMMKSLEGQVIRKQSKKF